MQQTMFENELETRFVSPFRLQLLKWVGNKQRFAHEIISFFPHEYGTYFEPFLGSGAVLGTLSPSQAIASDSYSPLIEIWQTLKTSPEKLVEWYSERWNKMMEGEKVEVYEKIKASFNENSNGADLLFLSRSCYGGVIRFRKQDGYMSTPCGPHKPISPESFKKRVKEWHIRTAGTQFHHMDFEKAMAMAIKGDLIYCDPPYSDSQGILYGAQEFSHEKLFQTIGICIERGVKVALSIDGTKKSGRHVVDLPIPQDLFKREVYVKTGRSMLKRFQMNGKTLEDEQVSDRLLLTW